MEKHLKRCFITNNEVSNTYRFAARFARATKKSAEFSADFFKKLYKTILHKQLYFEKH